LRQRSLAIILPLPSPVLSPGPQMKARSRRCGLSGEPWTRPVPCFRSGALSSMGPHRTIELSWLLLVVSLCDL